MKKIALLMVGCSLLSACVYQGNVPIPSASDHASIKIAEAATSASDSLNELARIEAEATPSVKGPHELPDPSKMGLAEVATIDWSGPVEPLLEQISKSLSYRLRVIGRRPKVALVVTLVAKNAPIGNILRDIDYQASHKANVAVYPNNRVIELRYVTT